MELSHSTNSRKRRKNFRLTMMLTVICSSRKCAAIIRLVRFLGLVSALPLSGKHMPSNKAHYFNLLCTELIMIRKYGKSPISLSRNGFAIGIAARLTFYHKVVVTTCRVTVVLANG